jgi:hypothetical protein
MVEEFERRSPVFDWDKGDFSLDPGGNVVTTTQGAAAEQIIIKALQTARGRYPIYANLENVDLDHKNGSDVQSILRDHTITQAVKEDEIKRSIKEALIYMEWIESVDNIEYAAVAGDISAIEASFTVTTTWDEVIELQGVNIDNG